MLCVRFFREVGRAVISLRRWLILLMVLVALSRPSPGLTAAAGDHGDQPVEPQAPIQTIEGRIANSGLQLFRLIGLKKGQTLYVYASTTAGYLDPLAFVLKPEADASELDREPLQALVEALARYHDPIEVTRQLLDRYAWLGPTTSKAVTLPPSPWMFRRTVTIGSPSGARSCARRPANIGSSSASMSPMSCPVGRRAAVPHSCSVRGDVGVLERAIVAVTGALEPD